jgi:hypothetical protein
VVTGTAIRIDRRSGWPWFRFQPFSIELDGSIVDKVRGGQTVRLPVSSGEHRIRVRFRTVVWSDPVVVALAEGEERILHCDTDWRGYPSLTARP